MPRGEPRGQRENEGIHDLSQTAPEQSSGRVEIQGMNLEEARERLDGDKRELSVLSEIKKPGKKTAKKIENLRESIQGYESYIKSQIIDSVKIEEPVLVKSSEENNTDEGRRVSKKEILEKIEGELIERLRAETVEMLEIIESLTSLGEDSFDGEDWSFLIRIKNILTQGPKKHPLAFGRENLEISKKRILRIKKNLAKKTKVNSGKSIARPKQPEKNEPVFKIPQDELEEMQKSAYEDFLEKDLEQKIINTRRRIDNIDDEINEIKEWQKKNIGNPDFDSSVLGYRQLQSKRSVLIGELKQLEKNKKEAEEKNLRAQTTQDNLKKLSKRLRQFLK